MNERGSVSILMAGFALVLVAAGAGAARVSQAIVLRRSAQTAADATALAAARDPARAQGIAAANGARVTAVTAGPGWVEVEVERRGAHARARARLEALGASGLDPRVRAALAAAEQRLGRRILVVSGYRSPAEQAALWARRFSNPFPVAPPGSSAHERGLAVDLTEADAAAVAGLGVGLCRPFANDPVHLELC